jgi:hypothetical protein
MNYKQCKLRKGNKSRIAWLPDKFAKEGKVLRLKKDDGWVVQEVWATDSEENVKARERDYNRWAVGRGLKK